MPVPYAPLITLAAEAQTQLEALTRAHSTPQALAFRCRLILRAAAPDRPSNGRLAAELECDRHTARLWRRRYLARARRPPGCATVGTTTALFPPVTGSRWSPWRRRNLPNGIARRHAGVWMIWWRRAATNPQPRP